MGMFGSIGRALGNFNEADPKTGVSWADRIAAASGALAGDPGAYGDFAKLKMQRQQQAQQQEILKELTGALGPQYTSNPDVDVRPRGMIGGSYLPTSALPRGGVPADAGNSYVPTPGQLNPPTSAADDAPASPAPYQFQMPQRTSDGMTIDDPRLPGMALRAQMAGVKMDPILEILKARKSEYVNGVRVNPYDNKAPGFIPTLDKGQEPVYNSNGQIVGVRNMDGSIRAAADMAGAVAGAQEEGKAGWDVIKVDQEDGSTVQTPRAAFVRGWNGAGGGPPGPGGAFPPLRGRVGGVPPVAAGGPRLGVSQTPAAASAAKIRGDAQANAQVDAPGRFSAIDNAIDIATRLRADPVLEKRTGGWAMLPAIPGTHGVAWDAMKKQLLGQVFLDAFGELKGAGQITEVEGTKATQAKARLEAAQTPEDFKVALDDYIASLNRGKDLMARRAGGSPAGAAPAPAAAQRQANTVYQTPRGPMKWTGTGWLPAN